MWEKLLCVRVIYLLSFPSSRRRRRRRRLRSQEPNFPRRKEGKSYCGGTRSLASLRKKAKTHHADTLLPGRNTFDSGEGERKSIILPFLFFHTRPREKSSSHSVDIVFLLLFSLISHEHFSSSPLSSLSSSSYWHCCKTRLVGKGTPTPPPPLSPLWHHENHCLLAWLCS